MGYETFPPVSQWAMKHFGGQSGGAMKHFEHETFNDYPGKRGYERLSLRPIRSMKLNGVALKGLRNILGSLKKSTPAGYAG